jgi:gamma-glutamyl:cysteine ligase YbdK (ATP-grasp superfamily)
MRRSIKNYPNNTFQFGAIAFYTARDDGKRKTASEKIGSILNNIESQAKNYLSESYTVKLVSKLHKDKNEESAWTAACLMLIPKNNTGGSK